MVTLYYQIIDESGAVESGPYQREFESTQDMYHWINVQNQHPWLSIDTLAIEGTA